QAEDGIRDRNVTGVQTCALPISDHEACAGHCWLAVFVRGAGAVLRPDPSAVRFDDLLGDREPEAGVLAKALVRPVGVEALEDPLDRKSVVEGKGVEGGGGRRREE